MQEHVVASDEAYVVVEETPNEELENPSTPETGEELTEMMQLAYQVVHALQQVHQSGDTFVAIAVNPAILDEFTHAFRSLPDDLISPRIKEQLPILPEEKVNPLKIITGTDMELQFFHARYGPREQGGTGLLPDLQAALQREQSPVRVTHDFLRTYYLLELAERASPKLYTPTGSDVLRALSPTLGQPNLTRR